MFSSSFSSAARPSKRQRRDYPITPLDHESMLCVAASTTITTPVPHATVVPIPRPIVTTPVSMLDKEIILERFVKEIVQYFDVSLSIPRGNKITTIGTATPSSSRVQKQPRQRPTKSLKRRILDQRMTIGSNQCTRALMESTSHDESPQQQQKPKVQLLLICRDIHPPTILAHVMTFGTAMHIPIVVLPGRSTLELGHALGIRKTAIVAFVSRRKQPDVNDDQSKTEKFIINTTTTTSISGDNNQSLPKAATVPKDNEMIEDEETINMYHAKIDSFIEFVISKLPCSAATTATTAAVDNAK